MENQGFNSFQNQPENNGFVIQQNLPNATAVLVLGIFSIIGCCCYGSGIIFGIIGFVLAKKDTKLYESNPQQYKGIGNLNTGKILCIIGFILSLISVTLSLYLEFTDHGQELQVQMMEWSQSMQQDI